MTACQYYVGKLCERFKSPPGLAHEAADTVSLEIQVLLLATIHLESMISQFPISSRFISPEPLLSRLSTRSSPSILDINLQASVLALRRRV